MAEKNLSSSSARNHLFEVDFIRSFTVFSVVAIHSLSYTKHLITAPQSLLVYYLFGHLLNYNREIFMFVTALVLTYVYQNRDISLKQFYSKRLLVVFVPYVVWSLFYTAINYYPQSLPEYLANSAWGILTGTASFQLYYILLTVQFYAVFPFFLTMIKKIRNYPVVTLLICFLVQLAWMYYDFHFLQTGKQQIPQNLATLFKYRDRIFIVYLFFFVLGGFAALYINNVTTFIKRFGIFVPFLLVATALLYTYHYFLQLTVQNIPVSRASGVLQPSVIIYGTVVIVFISWIAILWAKNKKMYSLIHTISSASFGVFFVHVLVLSFIQIVLLPHIPHGFPIAIIMVVTTVLAFSVSVLISSLFLKSSYISWMVGKPKK